MTTQWGAPLTGAQMNLLRAAGLPNSTQVKNGRAGSVWRLDQLGLSNDEYYLVTSHPAYMLAKAGWLDGRNVALWFGGEKAPDDWDGGGVLLADGTIGRGVNWKHAPEPIVHCYSPHAREHFIIAYIRKAEARTSPDTHSDRTIGRGLPSFEQPDTVTIAKMTDSPADWAIEKAREAMGLSTDYIAGGTFSAGILAFARYIEAHEDPPVDRKLLCAREAAASLVERYAAAIRRGLHDKTCERVVAGEKAIDLFVDGFGD